jgi:hypothetical protein
MNRRLFKPFESGPLRGKTKWPVSSGHAPWFDHADRVAQHAYRLLGVHPD